MKFDIKNISFLYRLIEGKTLTGSEWDIVIIEPGISLNNTWYTSELLKTAASKFEGAKVFAVASADRNFDHLDDDVKAASKGGPAKNLVGWLENVTYRSFRTATGKKSEGLVARFNITENAIWLRQLLSSSWQKGKHDLLGFSIDASGDAILVTSLNRRVRKVTSIDTVDSVDIVTHPAAKGGLLRLVASQGTMKFLEFLKKLRESAKKDFLTGFDASTEDEGAAQKIAIQAVEAQVSKHADASQFKEAMELQAILQMLKDGEVEAAMAELMKLIQATDDTREKEKPKEADPEKESKSDINDQDAKIAVLKADFDKQLADLAKDNSITESARLLSDALITSKLPQLAKARVKALCAGKILISEQIQEAIAQEKNYLAALAPNNPNVPGQGRGDISFGKNEREKAGHAMFGMLTGQDVVEDVRAYASLHESYRRIVGFAGSPKEMADEIIQAMAFAVPGRPGHEEMFEKHHSKLKESHSFKEALQTTTWAEVFGDSIRRALISEYQGFDVPDWTKIVSSVVPLQDFRVNRRIRVGGFGDLDTVGQLGTYQELANPGDEEVTYAAEKRGNLFSVSWEAIVNDDLGAVRDIPRKLGRAAARTLSKFVYVTLLSDNPLTDYDGVTLINAAHNNFQAAALTEATLNLAIQQMRRQTEFSSGERLGLTPKILVVPVELEDTAWELIKSKIKIVALDNATTPSVISELYGMEFVTNIWQIDVDNWQIITDPKKNPTAEIGFLGGRREPELFIQDQPNIGSFLTADRVTWKIRHIYGGDVLDHRGYAGSSL